MHLFISHATKDSGREALALAEALEALGHICWIAPRDVRPGIPYPRQIVEALEQCSGLVLLLSPAANDSADVLQEVQLAAQAKKTIAPVVLAGTAPGADLRYYVSVRHQIAWSGAEATARRLAETFHAPRRQERTEEAPLSPDGGRGQGEGAAVESRRAPRQLSAFDDFVSDAPVNLRRPTLGGALIAVLGVLVIMALLALVSAA